jgi:carboxyl-terminal processing protease
LKEFREKDVAAVILDLRRNGGGSLTEAISVTGLFIDEGPIVQVKDKMNNRHQYDDPEKGTAWDGPLVVLTSKFSASASEIFAGAIQDYGRGIIVGDTSTHGKGTVQSLVELSRQLFALNRNNVPDLGALKITMQQFYRPNGDSTQNRGVLADVELPSLTSQLDVGEEDLDYAMKFDHIAPLKYQKAGMVDKSMVERLNQLSRERRKKSEGFQAVLRNIERYQQQKSRKTLTLNEEKFMAERAVLNAEKDEEREIDSLSNPHRAVFDTKSFYNQETLAITVDYLRSVKLARN